MAAWMGTLRLLFCAASTPKMARPRARAMRKMPRPTPATSAMVVGCLPVGVSGLGGMLGPWLKLWKWRGGLVW